MKKTFVLVNIVFISLFLCVGGVFAEAPSSEEKIQPDKSINIHRIVRINYRGTVGTLIPNTVTVKPGSTIIWVNESRNPVEIQFQGKQVTVACKSPVHFVVNEEGSFISNRIPFGAVASLCFVEKGEFEYVARKADPLTGTEALETLETGRIQELKGKIIIKPE